MAYILARNAGEQVEYWTGSEWQTDKAAAKPFRTLQAIDRAAAKVTSDRPMYITTE